MSANINSMLYVGNTPWHGFGTKYDTAPTSSEEIIKGAGLDWSVSALPMTTSIHDRVQNYHAIYREDSNQVLGVINKQYPKLVQNTDAFNAFNNLLGKSIDVDTAASLGSGEKVFGCFKLKGNYKVQGEDFDHYLVVLNEHLKGDGKVTVINTPVRVVCQNTLSAALSNNVMKYRINITNDKAVNETLAMRIMDNVDSASKCLDKSAAQMLKSKVSREMIEKLLDELFPFIQASDDSLHARANEAIEDIRNTFITECMGADNLADFRGTQYQVFNALTDFDGHYFKNTDAGLDLDSRMKRLPGLAGEGTVTAKGLKVMSKLIA